MECRHLRDFVGLQSSEDLVQACLEVGDGHLVDSLAADTEFILEMLQQLLLNLRVRLLSDALAA